MSSVWSRRIAHLAIMLTLSFFAHAVHADTVSGSKKVVVLRVYFHDHTKTSRYTKTQVDDFFSKINTLWGAHSSYGNNSKVWGRWAHELGHAFQTGGPAHPSNYNSNFEQMDADYPGQTGLFEKQTSVAFGWMPDSKYQVINSVSGGRQVAIYAGEYDPASRPNMQAAKALLGSGGSAYYLISVRRRVLGDDLNDSFTPNGIPDEGVLIERVTPGGDPQVTLQGKGGDRDKLWHEGDTFTNASDGVTIAVTKKFDDDNYNVAVRYGDQSNKADVGINSWLSPPGNTYETTDIWVDSPVNNYGTFRYGTWPDLVGGTVPKGNGDDPAIGLVNRIYARVRNYGTATASNVVVHFDVTDPLGLGIAGSNGFKELGSVNSTKFPALASIPAGMRRSSATRTVMASRRTWTISRLQQALEHHQVGRPTLLLCTYGMTPLLTRNSSTWALIIRPFRPDGP